MTSPESHRFRLITRSDFDGLACAVLLKSLNMINEIMFVHPKDMQDGKIKVCETDITTNLPYVPGCHLAFDHHYSETLRIPKSERENLILDPDAPSAARVVYNYFGKESFPGISDELMSAVDKADSADFTREEVLHPKQWNLLSFLMDARTGLGRFRHFRISNYQLMMNLVDYYQSHTIEEILLLPDVRERSELYFSHEKKFDDQLNRCAKVYGPLVVIDLREEEVIYTGNRFKVYALYPNCNISLHVIWGLKGRNTVLAMGKSIFVKDSPVNVGELMLKFGGGGHHAAGTCQVPTYEAERVLKSLVTHVLQKEKAAGQALNDNRGQGF